MELRVVLVESQALKHELPTAKHISSEFQVSVHSYQPKIYMVWHLLQTLWEHSVKFLQRLCRNQVLEELQPETFVLFEFATGAMIQVNNPSVDAVFFSELGLLFVNTRSFLSFALFCHAL